MGPVVFAWRMSIGLRDFQHVSVDLHSMHNFGHLRISLFPENRVRLHVLSVVYH